MATWDEFRKAVRSWDDVELRTSSDEDLDSFELARDVKLPQSYREFAKTFGRCEIGNEDLYHFAAPGHNHGEGSKSDLDRLNDSRLKDAKYDNDPIAQSALFFATDQGGDNYAWNGSDLKAASPGEPPVYLRTDPNAPYRKVADSFGEFVLTYCFGADLRAWREAVERGEDLEDEDNEFQILVVPM